MLNVQKVSTPADRCLPIFSEFDRLADRIRLEAYHLFARRGSGDGHALDDWLEVALAGFEPSEISLTATPREIMIKPRHEQARNSDEAEAATLCRSEFRSDEVCPRVGS